MSGVKIKNVQRKKHNHRSEVIKVASIINLIKLAATMVAIGVACVVVRLGFKNMKILV